MCIKELRKAAEITQKQLAEAIGVSQPAVAYWEAGLSNPSLANLLAMAAVLGCTIADLFGEKSAAS